MSLADWIRAAGCRNLSVRRSEHLEVGQLYRRRHFGSVQSGGDLSDRTRRVRSYCIHSWIRRSLH